MRRACAWWDELNAREASGSTPHEKKQARRRDRGMGVVPTRTVWCCRAAREAPRTMPSIAAAPVSPFDAERGRGRSFNSGALLREAKSVTSEKEFGEFECPGSYHEYARVVRRACVFLLVGGATLMPSFFLLWSRRGLATRVPCPV